MKHDTPMELAEIESPSKEHRCRFPHDDRLRAMGFEIHGRPEHGENVWRRGPLLMTETEALLRLEEYRE